MKKVLRIFPRKTNATPTDENAIIGRFPNLFDQADEIHISVTFTWDIPFAEKLFNNWRHVAPTRMGGVAFNDMGKEFDPGMYLKKGYVITSRGCNNKCWFCSVWKRDGNIRELEIKDGWILTDDNILACSEDHIIKVFDMLKKQPNKSQFVGGLESKLLTQDIANRLKELKPYSMYFAYDTDDDFEPLLQARKYLSNAGFRNNDHNIRCYILIGYPKDTFDKAKKRIAQVYKNGFMPMTMLYRDNTGFRNNEWMKFNRQFANPTIMGYMCKNLK